MNHEHRVKIHTNQLYLTYPRITTALEIFFLYSWLQPTCEEFFIEMLNIGSVCVCGKPKTTVNIERFFRIKIKKNSVSLLTHTEY